LPATGGAVLAPRLKLAGEHRHQRIVAQLVMVDQILIAERNAEHPLADQCHHLVLDQVGAPLVVKARGKATHHVDGAIRRPQEQRAGIGGDRPGIKRRHHLAPLDGCKSKQIRATLCRHRGAPRFAKEALQHNDFSLIRGPDALNPVRNPG